MSIFFEKRENIFFKVVNSHAKTYSLRINDQYITIDGSGNWCKNPRLENYTITNSREKHEFRKKWMLELINQ